MNIIQKAIDGYLNDNPLVVVVFSNLTKHNNYNFIISYTEKSQSKPITYKNYNISVQGKSIIDGKSHITITEGKIYNNSDALKYNRVPTAYDYKDMPKIEKQDFSSFKEIINYLKEILGEEKYGMFIVKLMFKFPNLNIQNLI